MSMLSLEQDTKAGIWRVRDSWRADDGTKVRVCFAGKGLPPERQSAAEALVPEGIQVSWLQQIHSSQVLAAAPGSCGEGDALVTDRSRLGLSVVTADCVPVLLANRRQVAAIHAGWRGVAGEIVGAAMETFTEPIEVAWIGPAISGEVYEVGAEVADQVARVSTPDAVLSVPGRRLHVDLRRAVAHQLSSGGCREIRQVSGCTLKDEPSLWSYRRDGIQAGRNVSMIWRD